MSAESNILDFENLLPLAVVNAFTAAGFAAGIYTGLSDSEFQKQRPRVEVQYKHGGAEMPIRQLNDGTYRPQAFHGELHFALISDVTPEGKNTHGDYRAKVRSFLYTLLPRVNNTPGGLTWHKLLFMVETGAQYGFNPEKGEETSVLSFAIKFCITAPGYATLTAPVVDSSNSGNTDRTTGKILAV